MATIKRHFLTPAVAIIFSLLIGIIFIFAAKANPITAYYALLRAGFGCRGTGGFCAFLTMLQFATPLILSGLSALVAFRAGIFSIGQAGQLVLGAAGATWIAGSWLLPGMLHPAAALMAGVLAGAIWGIIPGFLKAYLNINEVIVTLILNPIALMAAAPVSWWLIPESARLQPLIPTTKLNFGFVIALGTAVIIHLYLQHTSAGYQHRMAGQAPTFAQYGGIHPRQMIVKAMALSGGLAGLAGAIEVLGVQYRFVSDFSASDQFDGLIVALVGQLHPIGVLFSSFLLGGVRLGAINGLQLETGVPRELGNILITMLVFFISAPHLFCRLLNRK